MKKCVITTKKLNIDFDFEQVDVYYIENYISFGNIKKARLLTDEIFLNNKEFIQKYDYDGYKITWSWYDKVYQFSLKYIEIESLINILKEKDYCVLELIDIGVDFEEVIKKYFYNKEILINKKFNCFILKIKEFIMNSILLLFSIISILYFILRKKNYTAIWIGDFIYKNTTSDFRLNHLYDKIKENNIDYIEFIRTRSLKDFFKNTYKRKRFTIYYFSFIYFIAFFKRNKKIAPSNFYQAIMYDYAIDNKIMISTIKLLKFLLIKININTLLSFTFISRNSHLHIAAKSLRIKTIGIMHGLSVKEYTVNEFIEIYYENKFLGPDVFGVWSDALVEYYKKYSKLVPHNCIVHSGLLRPLEDKYLLDNSDFKLIDEKSIKVLIISEPLVNAKEMLPYIKKLIDSNKFEISIKVRPMINDSFYEELKKNYPLLKNLTICDGNILDDGKKFDIFIGSHSTAVIEASLINKISILIETHKWGDFFDIKNLIKNEELCCGDENKLIEHIENRIKNENSLKTIGKIKNRFFGTNKDGAQWMIDEIRSKE